MSNLCRTIESLFEEELSLIIIGRDRIDPVAQITSTSHQITAHSLIIRGDEGSSEGGDDIVYCNRSCLCVFVGLLPG